MRASMMSGGKVLGDFEEGDPNIELLEKSAHAKMEYLTLNGQQLRFQLPLTEKNFHELNANDFELIRKAGVTIEHKNDLFTITFGKVEASRTSISANLPGKVFQTNATEFVSNRYGLTKGFDAARTRVKFFKDCDIRYLKK